MRGSRQTGRRRLTPVMFIGEMSPGMDHRASERYESRIDVKPRRSEACTVTVAVGRRGNLHRPQLPMPLSEVVA